MNSRRLVGQSFLAAGILLFVSPAVAGVWHQAATAPVSLEYDSNPDLSPTGGNSVWRSRFVPAYDLTGTLGVDEFKLGLALNLERSTDDKLSRDRQDPSLSLAWRRQTETGEFGMTAKYAEASTRITELAESGLVTADGTSTTRNLGGFLRSAISARSAIAADVDYKDVTYDGGAYTDYMNLTGGLTYSHAWSERAEPFLRVTASRYEPGNSLVSSSDSYGALVGMKWKATERLDWTAQAGATSISGQTDHAGWQGSFVLHYAGQRSDLALDVGRYVGASGEGGFAESDQVKGAFGYAIDERTKAGIEISWRDYKGATANTTRQFGAWVSRELTPFWNVRFAYQYKQRQENGTANASANVVGLTLVYIHPDF